MGTGDRDGADESACPDCGAEVAPGVNYCPDCGSVAGPSLATYCPNCGERFAADDRFCSECGEPRTVDESGRTRGSSGRDPRANRGARGRDGTPGSGRTPPDATGGADDFQAFRRRVESHLADGWKIERDYGDRVVLVRRDYGSAAAHLFLFVFTWFTFGFANLLYALYRHSMAADRLHLSMDGVDAPDRAIESDVQGKPSTYLLTLLSIVFGLAMVAELSLTGLLLGLVFLGVGFLYFPPMRRRLRRRHPPTKFGTVRTTDDSVVENPDDWCVVCGSMIDRGLERDYRQEKVVAGVPLYVEADGTNHYCSECATVEVGGENAPESTHEAVAPTEDAIDRELERELERETAE